MKVAKGSVNSQGERVGSKVWTDYKGLIMDLSQFLSRLEKYKKTGNTRWGEPQYMAPCPSHQDASPSLSITLGRNGGILCHCFGGCSVSDVCHAVGLSTSDLMPDNGYRQESFRRPTGASVDDFVVELFDHYVQSGQKVTQEDKKRYREAKMRGGEQNGFCQTVADKCFLSEFGI